MDYYDHSYDDIITLPHYVSENRKHILQYDRAAQFSPFAALTGYEGIIGETARLTDSRPEADGDRQNMIDERMQILIDNAPQRPEVTVTYFKADEKKSGGALITFSGRFRCFDEYAMQLVFTDKTVVDLCNVYNLESDIFRIYGQD